jgi:hypothetical protein
MIMDKSDNNRFAKLSIAEILVDIVMLFSTLVIFAMILYIVVPVNTINEQVRNLIHLAFLFFISIISGIIYAKRHGKVFFRGEHHYLIVILVICFIQVFMNLGSVDESLALKDILPVYWSWLIFILGPIITGAWTGGFIGSRIFPKKSPDIAELKGQE